MARVSFEVGDVSSKAAGDERLWFNNADVQIVYQGENPKKKGSKAFVLYEAYKDSTTVAQAKAAGATSTDLKHDFEKRFLRMAGAGSASDAHAEDSAHVVAAREQEKLKLQQLALVKDKLSPETKRFKSRSNDATTPIMAMPSLPMDDGFN